MLSLWKQSHELNALFSKFDDLGIISLNQWYVLDMKIRNYDDERKCSGYVNGSSIGITSIDEFTFFRHGDGERGISEVSIGLGSNNYYSPGYLCDYLCQECLDRVNNSLMSYSSESIKPYALCLVDFKTLEIYPIQKHIISYYVREYYIRLIFSENRIEVNAFYAPIIDNTS